MNERIRILLDLLHMSPAEMSVKLSVQRSTFSHLLSGRNKPSFDFISSFLSEFPNVNPDYLILGKQPYLRDDNNSPSMETKGLAPEKDLFKTPSNDANRVIPADSAQNNLVYKSNEPQIADPIEPKSESNQLVIPTKTPIKSSVEPDLVLVVHHYSDGTFSAYKPK